MVGINKFNNLVIPDGKVPVAAYQAIYHRITKSTEQLNSSYDKPCEFSRADIADLYRMLEQTVQQYKVEAKSLQVSFTFSDGEQERYSSFERFDIVNFDARQSHTTSMSFEFDFLIILPIEIEDAPEIAQRYRVSVSVMSQPDQEALYRYSEYGEPEILISKSN